MESQRGSLETIASKRIFVALIGLAMITVGAPILTGADSEDYSLFVSVDDTKVTIVSGNFSVAVTRNWPRVIFKHEVDPFSPFFEVSYSRMYVHNDSDCDGVFDHGEANLTVFLDSNHVEWNITAINQGFTDELGEYASFGMRSSLNAYAVGDNETLVRSRWANMTFWFSIAELPVQYECSRGNYIVDGGTQLRMNFTLSVREGIETGCLVMEQFLQGGASTNMFRLFESNVDGLTEVREALATVDERLLGDNYSHGFNCTSDVMQKIQFAKEDGIVQAFYLWGSDAVVEAAENRSTRLVNSSYFTTGNGMMLHSILPVDNVTTEVSHEYSTGIYESGFVGSVRDWLKEESALVSMLVIATVAIVVSAVVWRRKRREPYDEDLEEDDD
jgi:hypothetical protein